MKSKLIDIEGLSIFKSQLESVINDELDTLRDQLRVVNLLADESNFKAEANFRAFTYGFDYLCIEPFHTADDIDTTVDDGASVVANYYDANNHLIHKTSADTLTIQSRVFNLESNPYDALILIDYEGSGSVDMYISKNSGEDWKAISNDTLTSLNSLVQKHVKVKLVMTGEVILKNIAWGCK